MTKMKTIALGHVATRAIELLKQNPDGLSISQMRELLGETHGDQEHFNRRIRDIRKRYELIRFNKNGVWFYKLGNERSQTDSGQVSEKLRAAVLHLAHGKCQMCGKTINDDNIKLQADHKIPQSWGGATTQDNLWAICEACNRGKRNYFSSFPADEMKSIANIDSVHERIAKYLKLHSPNPVPAWALEFIANVRDQQIDWRKRLRELRYPPIGLQIDVSKKKDNKGVQSYYALMNWHELPEDHAKIIKEFEKENKKSRRHSK